MDAMEEVSNGDLLCLNVGGTLFHTRRQTLVGDGDCSLLASMFSGRWESGLTRDTAGNVFLDEDPETFKALLALLRKRDSGAGPVAQTLEGVSAPLLALVDKFLLREAFWPCPTACVSTTSIDVPGRHPRHHKVCEVTTQARPRGLLVRGGVQLVKTVEDSLATRNGADPAVRNPAVLPCSFRRLFGMDDRDLDAFLTAVSKQFENIFYLEARESELLWSDSAQGLPLAVLPAVFCVTLNKLSAGAVVGVASNGNAGGLSVCGVLALSEPGLEPCCPPYANILHAHYDGRVGGDGMSLLVYNGEVHSSSELLPNPLGEQAKATFVLRQGSTLKFTLTAAAPDVVIMSIVMINPDLLPHCIASTQTLVACMSLPTRDVCHGVWRPFVMPMPGDEVELKQLVDVLHPAAPV